MSTLQEFRLTYNGKDIGDIIVLILIKPLVVLFLYFAFFSRGAGIAGLSGGMTAVLLAFSLFFLCFLRIIFDRKIKTTPLFWLTFAFFFTAAVTPMVSSFVLNAVPRGAFQMGTEMTIAFAIFFAFYYLIREKIITPRFFIYALVGVGLFAAFQLVIILLSADAITRLRGIGGMNVVPNSFAVCAIAMMLITYRSFMNQERVRVFIGIGLLMIVLIVMLFSGSRQAVLAFIFGLMALNIFGFKGKEFRKYNLYGIAILALIIFIISLNIDIRSWFNRFSFERVTEMAFIRFDYYWRSVSDLTIAEFIFGRPDYYIFEREVQRIGGSQYVNPHNFLISLLRFNGILSFFIFLGLMGAFTFEAFKRRFVNQKHKHYLTTEATIVIFLLIPFIYTLFSGLMTRSLTLFTMMGYAIGYIDMLNTRPPKEEYEKMIL